MLYDIIEALGIRTAYLLGSIFKYTTHRDHIGNDVYLKTIKVPQESGPTLLILRGGLVHPDPEELSYYNKIIPLLTMNCRILVLEKSTPNLGINYVQDLRRSIEYIKNKYPGKVYILGVSMGGILLYTYLSEGYDSADGYITLCSPVNLEYFYESVRSNYVFRREAEKSFKILGISNIEELLTLCGVDQNYTSNLLSKIKNGKWHKKHLAIIGSDDILTSSFKDDIECINYIEVSGGYHCCLNTIWYACRSISYMSQGYTVRSTVKKVLEEVSLIS